MVLPSSIMSGIAAAAPSSGSLPPSPEPSQPPLPALRPDPGKRAEVEALESEIDLASLRLAQLVEKLGGELWPREWPAGPAALRQQIATAQAAEDGCGRELLSLQERSTQGGQLMDQQRQALRQRILSLSERTQLDKGLAVAERQQLLRSIEESERSLALLLSTPPRNFEAELHAVRLRLRELQQESRRGYDELAKLLVTAAPSSPLCAEIAQAEQQIEAARSMLALLSRKKRSP
jgi:hypothetical protein